MKGVEALEGIPIIDKAAFIHALKSNKQFGRVLSEAEALMHSMTTLDKELIVWPFLEYTKKLQSALKADLTLMNLLTKKRQNVMEDLCRFDVPDFATDEEVEKLYEGIIADLYAVLPHYLGHLEKIARNLDQVVHNPARIGDFVAEARELKVVIDNLIQNMHPRMTVLNKSGKIIALATALNKDQQNLHGRYMTLLDNAYPIG